MKNYYWLLILIVFTYPAYSQNLFRTGVFLHHSTGACIWGPNNSNTSIPNEIISYNSEHNYTGNNSVSLNEESWPLNPWDNEWYRWHNIFENNDPNADINSYFNSNKIIIIKSCFPSSSISSWGSVSDTLNPTLKTVNNYKWHWRSIIKIMSMHPDNFFVIWTNAPLVAAATNDNEALLSHQFCKWAKDTLFLGRDPEMPDFPRNVYIFDFFHKLVDNTYKLPLIYAASEYDSHPNGAATELVAPSFVSEIFNKSILYESYYNSFVSPILVSPANGAIDLSLTPVLNWNSVSVADGYRIQVSNTQDFTNTVLDTQVVYLTSCIIPQGKLFVSTTYYWRICAVAGYLNGPWSTIWNFTTGLASPTMTTPPNATANIPTSFVFSWLPISGADSYDLQVSNNPEFSTTVINQTNLTRAYYFALMALNSNITYWWRVRANYPTGTSPWANPYYFTTGNSLIVNVGTGVLFNTSTTYPAVYGNYNMGSKHQILIRASEIIASGGGSGIIAGIGFYIAALNNIDTLVNFNIRIKPTTLTSLSGGFDNSANGWIEVVSDSNYKPIISLNYHLFNALFQWDGISNLIIETCFNNTGTSFNASILRNVTSYQSVARYSANNSNVCSSTTTTQLSNLRPNIAFAILQPPDIAQPVGLSPHQDSLNVTVNPNFIWTSVQQATSYQLQISKDVGFGTIEHDITGISDTVYLFSGLDYQTRYYWRVRAINGNSISLWSIIITFVTGQNLSGEISIPLIENWNLISSNVAPSDPLMTSIFAPLGTNMLLVKDGVGSVFWPEWGIDDLGSWNICMGYQVFMNQIDTLVITGTSIIPETTLMTYDSQWQMISYLRTSPMAPPTALVSLGSNLVILKDNIGNVYWPEWGIQDIDYMIPGQGYQIYITEPDILIYPGN